MSFDKHMGKEHRKQYYNGTYLCTKKVVKKSIYKMDKHEPDFIVFVVDRDKKGAPIQDINTNKKLDINNEDTRLRLEALVNRCGIAL